MVAKKKNNNTAGMDKRMLKSITKGFECRMKIGDDGAPKIAVTRDTEYGIDFIGREGFDRSRAKSDEKTPSLAWHNIALPKDYILIDEKNKEEFHPTPAMVNYLRALCKNKNDEKKAIAEADIVKKTLDKWREIEGFDNFINKGYLKAISRRLPALLESAMSEAKAGNIQSLKLLIEELKPAEIVESKKLTPIDFSKYLEKVRANDFECR